jgi:hypothetical protein
MILTIGSIFRNATGYLKHYFDQVVQLHGHLYPLSAVQLVLVEGDSTDSTWDDLSAQIERIRPLGIRSRLVKREHGGPVFGSIDNEQRWRNISYACNGVFENLPKVFDAMIYVESDLLWQPQTVLALVEHLKTVPAVSPMSFHRDGFFYDIWGYRRNGICFTPSPPYHPDLAGAPDNLLPIDSAGSCIAMRAEVARQARFAYPEQGILGFCRSIYDHGYSLHLDPNQRVIHP